MLYMSNYAKSMEPKGVGFNFPMILMIYCKVQVQVRQGHPLVIRTATGLSLLLSWPPGHRATQRYPICIYPFCKYRRIYTIFSLDVGKETINLTQIKHV